MIDKAKGPRRPASAPHALLRGVPYFAALPDDVVEALANVASSGGSTRGQVIFIEGEPCAGLYIVGEGAVKIYKLSPQGREQIVHQLEAGSTFNDVAVLDGGGNPASAAASSDCNTLGDRAPGYPSVSPRPIRPWPGP